MNSPVRESSGDPRSKLWLIGDSPPEQWKMALTEPLDRRHPARHSIWTPIADVIQEHVYRKMGWRMDEEGLYVRNAVSAVVKKPKGGGAVWGPETASEMAKLDGLVKEHQPLLLVTFGAFAFEFVRRCLGEAGRQFCEWTTKEMGEEMRQRIRRFSPDRSNILPALHATIARGRFLESHRDYCAGHHENYFHYVGRELSQVLIEHADHFGIFRQFVHGK
jgi:hypothetical protein